MFRSVAPITVAVAVLSFAFSTSPPAHGLSFNPHFSASLSDNSPNAAADLTLDFSIDAPDPQFEAIVSFLPSEMYIAPDEDVPNGAIAGQLDAEATLGVFNADCNTHLPVHFDLMEGNTDIHDTINLYYGIDDNDRNGLPDNVDRYPDFLTRLAPDTQPIQRFYGQTPVVGVETTVNFVVFAPGTQIAHLPVMDTSLGYPVVIYLNDPTSVPPPWAITDFCSPLGTITKSLGTSLDNPSTTANEAGFTLKRNPENVGDYNSIGFIRTWWDADGDGIENTLDPCPLKADTGWNPRGGDNLASDPDFDGLPSTCDPTPDDANIDQDGDGYQNRQDTCPLVATGIYPLDTDHDGIGDSCDPFVLDATNGGTATRVQVCVSDVIIVGEGGPPARDFECPNGPDVIPPLVFYLDAPSVLGIGAEDDVSALIADPDTGAVITTGTLNFEVTGANPMSGSCDLKSPCIFKYVGQNLGVDTITASGTVAGRDVSESVSTEWMTPPANDAFAAAQEIASLPFDDTQQLATTTGEDAEPDDCTIPIHTLWYKFTPTSDVFLKVEATVMGGSYADLGLFDAETAFGLNAVECGYRDYPPYAGNNSVAGTDRPPEAESYLYANLEAGKTYYLQVGGHYFVGAGSAVVEAEQAVLGDANCDGSNDVIDVLAMLKYTVGFGGADCYGASNFDCNGFPGSADILATLKLIMGLPVSQQCGKD